MALVVRGPDAFENLSCVAREFLDPSSLENGTLYIGYSASREGIGESHSSWFVHGQDRGFAKPRIFSCSLYYFRSYLPEIFLGGRTAVWAGGFF